MTAQQKLALARVDHFLGGKAKPNPSSRFSAIWPTPLDLDRDLRTLVAMIREPAQ